MEVRGLTRAFGTRVAVRELDLTVREGDVYGFLGPNGAGKTTAMRCILGLIRRDKGEVTIFGDRHRRAQLRHVGAIVETPAFHDWLSGRRNLSLACDYLGLSGSKASTEIGRVLERVGLSERATDRAGVYSLGMKQRLAIARALLGRPRLLMLDEPTNGLDPKGMREVRELVRSLALHDAITVFVSSHLLTEVQAICNRVAILQDGVMRAEGEVAALLAGDASPTATVQVGAPDLEALKTATTSLDGATVAGTAGADRLRLQLVGVEIPALVAHLVAAGVAVEAVVPERRSLEDVFLEVTTGAPQ